MLAAFAKTGCLLLVLVFAGCRTSGEFASTPPDEALPIPSPQIDRQTALPRDVDNEAQPAPSQTVPKGVVPLVIVGDDAPQSPPEPLYGHTPPPCADDGACTECSAWQPDSLKTDLKNFTCHTITDARDVINKDNLLFLSLAAGGAIGFHQDLDGRIRRDTARNRLRWGDGSQFLGNAGDVHVQVPVLVGLYGLGRWRQDEELDDFSGTLLRAYAVNAAYTSLIKAAVDTDRPSNVESDGRYGFPSFHTSSNFTIAAVVDEYYGKKAALPLYAFAGLVGWSRIDERAHDLSDVFFGAALGYVIGKSVAGNNLTGDPRVRLVPYTHPTDGSTGLALEANY